MYWLRDRAAWPDRARSLEQSRQSSAARLPDRLERLEAGGPAGGVDADALG